MTTKGQRRLARWQARHVLQLGFADEPEFEKEEDVKKGASVVIAQDSERNCASERNNEDDEEKSSEAAAEVSSATDEVASVEKPQPNKQVGYLRKFNVYESTDSEEDYSDLFGEKLVALIQRDFSRLNL